MEYRKLTGRTNQEPIEPRYLYGKAPTLWSEGEGRRHLRDKPKKKQMSFPGSSGRDVREVLLGNAGELNLLFAAVGFTKQQAVEVSKIRFALVPPDLCLQDGKLGFKTDYLGFQFIFQNSKFAKQRRAFTIQARITTGTMVPGRYGSDDFGPKQVLPRLLMAWPLMVSAASVWFSLHPPNRYVHISRMLPAEFTSVSCFPLPSAVCVDV